MFESAAPYVIASFAMLFSGLSAFTLITTVNHFDPPAGATPPDAAGKQAA